LAVNSNFEQGFELDNLIVIPGSFAAGLRGAGFSAADVANVKTVQNVTLVTPMITLPTAVVNDTVSQMKVGAFTVAAISFTEMQEMLPQRFVLQAGGHFPDENESNGMVLGYDAAVVNGTVIAKVGDNVTLAMVAGTSTSPILYNETYTVTGVLVESGTSGLTNFNFWAFIPMETAQSIPGVGGSYQIILVKVNNSKNAQTVANSIQDKFPPYSITVFVPSSLVDQVNNILNLITIFLLSVASISLIVAGVGIMNIMTVSVMERTREIGIMKAIGAKSRTVLAMFLTETILIGVIGGIIGIILGYGLSYALAYGLSGVVQSSQQSGLQTPGTQKISITPVFSPEWTIIAVAFSIGICLIFGLYPARKAAKLNPVQALRYE
jgi:putative ABC transport system permease protein